jgi:hypothetical protein
MCIERLRSAWHRYKYGRVSFDSVREMLELLEDKLREYRMLTLNPREYDDRTVTLSQLDSLRRELIDTARTNMAFIIFGKVRGGPGLVTSSNTLR